MKETEITVEVLEPLEEVFNKLEKNGFKYSHSFIMTDNYYSKYSNDILESFDFPNLIKNSFLIRSFDENYKKEHLLIYKNKVLDNLGNVISEEKSSTIISDLDATKKIFEFAGLNNWCNLEQHISIYIKENTELAIQEVIGLGNFIEYEEGKGMAHLSEKEKINTLVNNLYSLNLKLGQDYSCKKALLKFKQR